VAGEIVHHDDVALPQGGYQTLFDIGAEGGLAIDRAVEHTGSGDFADAQSCNEGRRFPMSPRCRGEQALEELRPLIAAEPVRPMSPAEAVRFYYTEYREAAGLGIA
jgi:hypothetical protein